jgi:heme-degrading monooxygenase HmoA
MHARSGQLQVSPDRIDDAVQAIKDRIPQYREQNGYKGFTVLVNRETGNVFGVSFWESEADRDASDDLGRQAREQAAERGGSQSAPVREAWEVAFDDMV